MRTLDRTTRGVCDEAPPDERPEARAARVVALVNRHADYARQSRRLIAAVRAAPPEQPGRGGVHHRVRRIEGRRFGRLVVRAMTPLRQGGAVVWACDCDCGGKGKGVSSRDLLAGNVRSCGCLRGRRAA